MRIVKVPRYYELADVELIGFVLGEIALDEVDPVTGNPYQVFRVDIVRNDTAVDDDRRILRALRSVTTRMEQAMGFL